MIEPSTIDPLPTDPLDELAELGVPHDAALGVLAWHQDRAARMRTDGGIAMLSRALGYLLDAQGERNLLSRTAGLCWGMGLGEGITGMDATTAAPLLGMTKQALSQAATRAREAMMEGPKVVRLPTPGKESIRRGI